MAAQPREDFETIAAERPYPSRFGCAAQEESTSFADAKYWECVESLSPMEQTQLSEIWFAEFGYGNVDDYGRDDYGRDWYEPGETQLFFSEEKACGLHWRLAYPSAAERRDPNFQNEYQAANSEWSLLEEGEVPAVYLFFRLSFLNPDIRKERCEGIFGEGSFIDLFMPDDDYWELSDRKHAQEVLRTEIIEQLGRALNACPDVLWRALGSIEDQHEQRAYRLIRELEEADHAGGIAAELEILASYNDEIEEEIARVETICGLR
jgi:hypothetical protein